MRQILCDACGQPCRIWAQFIIHTGPCRRRRPQLKVVEVPSIGSLEICEACWAAFGLPGHCIHPTQAAADLVVQRIKSAFQRQRRALE